MCSNIYTNREMERICDWKSFVTRKPHHSDEMTNESSKCVRLADVSDVTKHFWLMQRVMSVRRSWLTSAVNWDFSLVFFYGGIKCQMDPVWFLFLRARHHCDPKKSVFLVYWWKIDLSCLPPKKREEAFEYNVVRSPLQRRSIFSRQRLK